MNQILVLKNLAINEGSPSNVAALKDITNLKQGAVAFVLDGNLLYDVLAPTTDFASKQRVQIVAGINPGVNSVGKEISLQSSVPIARRQVLSVNYEKYVAPQTQIVTIGPFNWETEGDADIHLMDKSYVGTILTNEIRVSEYKLPAITASAILDKIVDRINNGTGIPGHKPFNSFCTAAKTGTTTADFKLELTMKTEHVNFAVSLGGMFSFAPVVTTRAAKISLGKGQDVLNMEKEASGNLGNGGYWGYNEGYFSKPLETDLSLNYDIFQICFQGEHDTPQNRTRVAVNYLTLAIPTGSALVGTVKTALNVLFGSAFDGASGAVVPAEDETVEIDGTVGTV